MKCANSLDSLEQAARNQAEPARIRGAAGAGRKSKCVKVIMRNVFLLLLLLPLALLTGCDPIFGVTRNARVQFMPEPALVGATIKSTPGVDKVDYHFEEGGRPLTWSGIKPPDQVYTFVYRGGTNVHGAVQFIVDYKKSVEYSQTLLEMGRPPAQEWIDATRPVMKQIEVELEKNCGLTNLQTKVVERCIRVKCK